MPNNENHMQRDLTQEENITLSERLEKVDQELGYPDIEVDRDELNDIWNNLVD